jgi:GAF domain-containing protein/PAS domain-containing protein
VTSDIQRSRAWIAPAVGLIATLAVAIIDLLGESAVVLIPLLVVGPLVAATNDEPKWTLMVGAVAVALSVPLGWLDDIGGSLRHIVAIAVNVLGTVLAWRLAAAREQREQAIREAAPSLERAARLTAALHAGKMGEWWWDRASGAVGWDDELAGLFGIRPEDFNGTFEGWVELIDERDREMVLASVSEGVARAEAFRFDHRVVWGDGSVHWIEGIGEVLIGRDGEVEGAVGLAADVDERHRELDQRNHLMEVERRARLRVEYLARVQGVLTTSLDAEEILDRVTNAAVPDLADWCSAVLAIDRPRHDPTIVAAHKDEAMRAWALEVQRQFPYDPDAPFGAAKVIQTGETEVLTGLSALRQRAGAGQEVLERADVESVITVAIVGPLGVLGSLQLIRGHNRAAFSDNEVELIEELAGRCGAALHTAILFARQATSRAALDTLQRVSGGLASAATRNQVAHAVIAHGMSGVSAAGAAVFVSVEEGLALVAAEGISPSGTEAVHALAEQAVADETISRQTVDVGGGLAALVTPLRFLNRTAGALVFVFPAPRSFADDEISMLVTLAARCAGALERASLYERERETALVLQRRLLPDIPNVPPWLDVAARYEPAAGGQIGGDWYQLVDGGPGRMMAIVGDAVGHGVSSAAAMGQLRASIATAVSSIPDLETAMHIVDTFAAQGMDTIGASAAFALFDEGGTFEYGSAGHPPLVHVPYRQPARLLEGGRRPLLGFNAPSSSPNAPSEQATFGSGDMVVMYTDGLIERRGESIDEGLARLVRLIEASRDLSPTDICNALIPEIDGTQNDDIAVLTILRR